VAAAAGLVAGWALTFMLSAPLLALRCPACDNSCPPLPSTQTQQQQQQQQVAPNAKFENDSRHLLLLERIRQLEQQLTEGERRDPQCRCPTCPEKLIPEEKLPLGCPPPAQSAQQNFPRRSLAASTPSLTITTVEEHARLFPLPKASPPVRICLVTSALSGPTLNGGIGTAFYSMARHLAGEASAFQVTVLYAAHPYYGAGNEQQWVATFARFGIDFRVLSREADEQQYFGHKFVVRAFRTFEYLMSRQDDFDIISYHDYMALGYYIALAKHQGLAFANVHLSVQCHSTVRWADMLNYRPPRDHNTLGYYYMEQKSIEYADSRVSPSRYYLEWMRDEGGYDLGTHGRNFVVQNLLYPFDPQRVPAAGAARKTTALVFFGRLEVRKGLLVFLDALDALFATPTAPRPELVAFLGPDTSIEKQSAVAIIRERSKLGRWTCRTVIENQFDTFRALTYIKEAVCREVVLFCCLKRGRKKERKFHR
jgi:hypothetical protein